MIGVSTHKILVQENQKSLRKLFLSALAEKDHWVTALHSLGWWKTSRTHWSSIATPPSPLYPPAYLSITTQGTVWPNIAEMSVLYLLRMKLRSSMGVCFFWQWSDKVRPNTLFQIESSFFMKTSQFAALDQVQRHKPLILVLPWLIISTFFNSERAMSIENCKKYPKRMLLFDNLGLKPRSLRLLGYQPGTSKSCIACTSGSWHLLSTL